jgi:hypothetical protein
VSAGGRRFSVQVPDWGQDHLSPEAVVAFVDGELGERPYDRATRHLAECGECAAQVVAQGQARAALRSARCPSLPSSLITSLRSIPQDTDLPPAPNGLAMGRDGQFVALLDSAPATRSNPSRPAPPAAQAASALAAAPPAGLAEPLAPSRSRRGRLTTGAAMSGLALGALAIGAAIIAGDAASSPVSGPVTVDAHLESPGAP